MRIRSITTMIFAGALLMISAIAAACGSDNGSGGDTLSLEDYMAELDTLDDQYDKRTNDLEAQFDEDVVTAGPEIEAVMRLSRDFFRDGARAVSEFVNSIDLLNPPPEAEPIHNRAVTAGRELIAAFDDLENQLQDASSEQDFSAVMNSFAAETDGDEFTRACEDMQALADENSIDVTLSCG